MKVNAYKCQNCGANISSNILTNSKASFCPFCGQQFHISDVDEHIVVDKNININKSININKRTFNEAEVIRAKTERRNDRLSLVMIGLLLLPMLLWLGFDALNERKSESEGKVKVGIWYKDLIGKNYKAVIPQLNAIGFENIDTVDLNDAGWFNNKADTIDTISINGNSTFSSGDYFFITDKVIIVYH